MATTADARSRRPDPDRLAELEEERAFLLRSLDDLDREHEAGDIDDADYETLRDGYTARTAAVLRAIESEQIARPARRRANMRRVAAWAGLVVAVAVLAGVLVAWASGNRLPGDSSSGDITQNVTSELAEARSLQSSDLKGAIQRYDDVLKVEPDNAEALAYRGWLVVLVGNQAKAADLVQTGEKSLQRAMQVAPSYADPFCFEAIVRFRMYNDAAGALPPVKQCLALNPPSEVAGLVQGLQQQITAALGGSATTTAPAG
jgi:predicted anti-sigma-YlaC factor YlaD